MDEVSAEARVSDLSKGALVAVAIHRTEHKGRWEGMMGSGSNREHWRP